MESNMKAASIASIMIRSADPMRLAAWYAEVIGANFDERLDAGCFGTLGDLQFGILPTKPAPAPSTSRLAITYAITEFDETLKLLARYNIAYHSTQATPSQRIAYLRDPDDNELALVEAKS